MRLITNQPILREELADVVRLFFGLEPVTIVSPGEPDTGEGTAALLVAERGGRWQMTASLRLPGNDEAVRHDEVTAENGGDVLRKRMMRRYAKLCLYRLLKERTGITPPWGSLTGIRPTRLFRQLMQEGRTREQTHAYFTGTLDVSGEKAALVAEILDAQQGFIRFGDDRSVDVYVGIPFCRTRCLYCSFISVDLSKTNRWVDEYVEALLRELEDGAALLRELGKTVRAVYVGGGTPTAVGRQRLQAVLERIRSCWDGQYEFTVEAGRPDSLDADMLAMIAGCGVQRVSINPQTMSDATLCRVGRAHTSGDVLRALDAAARLPFTAINMDLIMGLPGEGEEEATHTLQIVSGLPIHNLTVHTLAVKRSSALHETLSTVSLPDAATVEACIALSQRAAASMGMIPYYLYRQKYMTGNLENVGYTLSGRQCLYNIDMMEETHSVVAFGAGGISRRMDFSRSVHKRLANPKGVPYYIERIDSAMEKKRAFFDDRINR